MYKKIYVPVDNSAHSNRAIESAVRLGKAFEAELWTGEDGKRRAISRWYYLLLEPETPWTTWLWPLRK